MVDSSSGTDDGETSSEESVREAPCRLGNRYKVKCPRCKRTVALKTLRYSHKCPVDPSEYVQANYRAAARAAWFRNAAPATAPAPSVVPAAVPATVPAPAVVPKSVPPSKYGGLRIT